MPAAGTVRPAAGVELLAARAGGVAVDVHLGDVAVDGFENGLVHLCAPPTGFLSHKSDGEPRHTEEAEDPPMSGQIASRE